MVAGICHLGVEGAFLKADESVDELEYRAGRIRSLHRTVEHRLVRVLDNLVVVLAYVGEHADVNTRTGYQGEDLTRLRFDRHKASDLVLHELLPVLLEVGVDGGDDVVAGNGFLVHLSVLVRTFDLVA